MDGAHSGYGMEDALKGVLGGEQPTKLYSAMEFRQYIEDAPHSPDTYDDTGRACAKIVLHFLERHPEASEMQADSKIEFGKFENGETNWEDHYIAVEGLYEYIKRVEPQTYAENDHIFGELTGFMWGWAVNAARRCLELPAVPNPAIMTINIPETGE